ncbi:hypothetical protein [Marinobacter sp. C2H3]|uniref:hypothetical protein n=1 Tax=Marinobacter sp. C2H3 TaxID=3119003 RepID=UPI00300E7682
MANKEICVRSLRKEFLIFERKRKSSHQALREGLVQICGSHGFHFIDMPTMQALNARIIEYGVGGEAHYNYKKICEFELAFEGNERGVDIARYLEEKRFGFLYVVPFSWVYFGGFLIDGGMFFSNLYEISGFFDDDFTVYDVGFNNSASFSCVTRESGLLVFEVKCRGAVFDFLRRFQ